MRRALTGIILILILSAFSFAQDTHPYTINDHLSMKRVSGLTLSPCGKMLAFNLTEYSLEDNNGSTSIYLVPAAGGEPKFFAKGSSPVWSPDGSQMAISRGGQIWLISMEGGEAKQLTSLATGAGGVKWSPDSKKILFNSMVWPGVSLKETEEKLEKMNKSPVKAFVTEELMFRHWDTWRSDGRKSHLFIMDVASGEIKDLTPDAKYDVPPFPFGGSGDYAFSPDGKEVAFIAKVEPREERHTNSDILLVPAAGGEIKNITAENKAQDSGPVVYSPDGKYIAYGAMERPVFEADRIQLMLYDRATGKKRSISENFDSSATGWTFTSDSNSLFFIAQEKGRKPVFKVSIKGNDVTAVVRGHSMDNVLVDKEMKRIYFTRQSFTHPVDIYAADIDGKNEVQITDVNKDLLAKIAMPTVEEKWYKGAMDDPVQMFMLYPHNFDPNKKWPVVVLIHGGPQGVFGDDFHYRWNGSLFCAPGYVVACINFHGSTGYGQKFTDAITRNWGGYPYIDIMKGMDELAKMPFVDVSKIGAAGGSYGGYMMNWIATQTDRFAALVSHAGVFNLESMYGATEESWFPEWEYGGPYWDAPEDYRKWSPHAHAKNLGKFKTPVFVIHGQHDYRVIVTQGFEMYTALQRQDVPSRLLYYPDETHFVVKPQNAELWYNEVHNWFKRWLGAGPVN